MRPPSPRSSSNAEWDVERRRAGGTVRTIAVPRAVPNLGERAVDPGVTGLCIRLNRSGFSGGGGHTLRAPNWLSAPLAFPAYGCLLSLDRGPPQGSDHVGGGRVGKLQWGEEGGGLGG